MPLCTTEIRSIERIDNDTVNERDTKHLNGRTMTPFTKETPNIERMDNDTVHESDGWIMTSFTKETPNI